MASLRCYSMIKAMGSVTYSLKAMAAARLLAEVTALSVVATVPIVLLLNGSFSTLPVPTRVVAVVACLVAFIMVPAYGFVTYKVRLSDEGLETIALFRRQFAAWHNIKGLHLKTACGMRRYVVTTEKGVEELTFPVWFNDLRQLCQSIRLRLPQSASAGGSPAPKMYSMAPTAFALQTGKLIGGLVLLGIFWQFAVTLKQDSAHSSDREFMFAACTVFSILWLAHAYFAWLNPRRIITDAEGVTFIGAVGQRRFEWSGLKRVSSASFLLPEGLIVTSARGFGYISDQFDGFDELADELARRVPPQAVPISGPQKNA